MIDSTVNVSELFSFSEEQQYTKTANAVLRKQQCETVDT